MIGITGTLKPTYMYEANMTNSTYYGRLGQALVQTDYYASVVETGGLIPTVFHLTGGQWKMLVPSQNYKKLPLFYATKYYNKLCKGNILKTELESSQSGKDPVGCHVYADGESFGVLLISRDFENDWTLQLDLPNELEILTPTSVMMYTISGDSYSSRDAHVDSTLITLSDSLLVTVPKHSMVVFGFDGSGASPEDVPLGFFEYVSAGNISILTYEGDEDFSIEKGNKLILKAHVDPQDVFSNTVLWSVPDNDVGATFSLKSYGFELRGSGTCEGSGIIKVRATAWDNPEIYDEVEVIITGQGSNCSTDILEGEGRALRIYPNPADDLLYLEGLPEGVEQLEVTDITGRRYLVEACTETSTNIDLSELNAGVYYLKIYGQNGTLSRSFICE